MCWQFGCIWVFKQSGAKGKKNFFSKKLSKKIFPQNFSKNIFDLNNIFLFKKVFLPKKVFFTKKKFFVSNKSVKKTGSRYDFPGVDHEGRQTCRL